MAQAEWGEKPRESVTVMLFELSQVCRALFRARAVTGAERIFSQQFGENIRAADGVGCADFVCICSLFGRRPQLQYMFIPLNDGS